MELDGHRAVNGEGFAIYASAASCRGRSLGLLSADEGICSLIKVSLWVRERQPQEICLTRAWSRALACCARRRSGAYR